MQLVNSLKYNVLFIKKGTQIFVSLYPFQVLVWPFEDFTDYSVKSSLIHNFQENTFVLSSHSGFLLLGFLSPHKCRTKKVNFNNLIFPLFSQVLRFRRLVRAGLLPPPGGQGGALQEQGGGVRIRGERLLHPAHSGGRHRRPRPGRHRGRPHHEEEQGEVGKASTSDAHIIFFKKKLLNTLVLALKLIAEKWKLFIFFIYLS